MLPWGKASQCLWETAVGDLCPRDLSMGSVTRVRRNMLHSVGMVQVAPKRHKTMPKSVVIRCSQVDCRRRVRRKPHAGSRYCSARCRTAAYRDRKRQQVLVIAIALRLEALKGDAARERVRTRAIRGSVIREVRDLLFAGRGGRGCQSPGSIGQSSPGSMDHPVGL